MQFNRAFMVKQAIYQTLHISFILTFETSSRAGRPVVFSSTECAQKITAVGRPKLDLVHNANAIL